MTEPEYTSVLAFVEFLIDDEVETFSALDLQTLSAATQTSIKRLRAELEGWGLRLDPREPERRVRGYTANPHDRWYGPGACRTHGGSGWEQINGFGGQES
jgi:hypothetical protein